MVARNLRDTLERRLRAQLAADPAAWFDRAVAMARGGGQGPLLQAYADASRHLGREVLADSPSSGSDQEPSAGSPDSAGDPFAGWSLEDAGRLVLLLTRAETADPGAAAADALACYEQGDSREQRSWLRGVAWLPDPVSYLPVVVEACRTNILPLFEAVACDNPYPRDHFPERNFNQMVLKALFNGVPLARVRGLAARANPELARMANDYAAERRAAARSVPADIGLATAAAEPRTER